MMVSVRLSDKEEALFRNYARLNGMSMSDLIRESVMERIEDEYDLRAYEMSIEEYKKNPVTYSLDEVESELGLR